MRWRDWYGDGSLHVCEVGLACCVLEVEAAAWAAGAEAATQWPDGAEAATQWPDGAEVSTQWPDRGLVEHARVVVVVSGTVTDRLAPAVVALINACAERTRRVPTVVALGACASSGGPYWDSYAVTKGVDALVPVDVDVPGCPPPPAALQAALDDLRATA